MRESTEQKGCVYCTKLENLLKYYCFVVYIDQNKIVFDNDTKKAVRYRKINYCPMCGRKLVKE